MKALLDNRADLNLPAVSRNGKARLQAMHDEQLSTKQNVLKVSYSSAGTVLIIGAEAEAHSIAKRLKTQTKNKLIIAISEPDTSHDDVPQSPNVSANEAIVIRCTITKLSGHLGNFVAETEISNNNVNLAEITALGKSNFDIVLDLNQPPLIRSEIAPPGYFAPVGDSSLLEQALAEIPELIGEFEKPTYFHYQPNICAHGNSGLQGCSRCITACPTQAIRSIGDLIEVNPHLCQGAGSCVTTCPTGAITYTLPQANECLFEIKNKLKVYHEQGGHQPCLLFHDKDTGRQQLSRVASEMPENILPYEIEEIGAVGMDICLATLAYATSHVLILTTSSTPPSVYAALQDQINFSQQILSGLNLVPQRITLLTAQTDESLIDYLHALPAQKEFEAATFVTSNEKRNTIRMALMHLSKHAIHSPQSVEMSSGAPFGEIIINKNKCTLCMACVSVCPVSALQDHPDQPKLSFIEENCMQCGLCATACPEDAIRLHPRITFDFERRQRARVLHEEQPFCCIVCGKAFASKSIIHEMEKKLSDHWMFQNEDALKRLRMCEDCRIKDMVKKDTLII